jgi:hypothetical protein
VVLRRRGCRPSWWSLLNGKHGAPITAYTVRACRYRRFVGNAWVQDQAEQGLLKFCPFPNCEHVADARRVQSIDLRTKPAIVKCLCKRKFCFLCQEEAHSPATVSELRPMGAPN